MPLMLPLDAADFHGDVEVLLSLDSWQWFRESRLFSPPICKSRLSSAEVP